MSILFWSSVCFLVYSFVLVPIFMEMELGNPKRTQEGRLNLKVEGERIINILYPCKRKKRDRNPTAYQLYTEVYRELIFCLFVFFLLFVLVYSVAPLFFMAGFFPNPLFITGKGHLNPYYPYEKIGNKKWIAPWKCVLLVGFGAGIYFYGREIATHYLFSTMAMVVYGIIVAVVSFVIVFNKRRKTESFVAMKEMFFSFINRNGNKKSK